MIRTSHQRSKRSKLIWLSLLALLVIGMTLIILEKTNTTDFIKMPDDQTATSGPTEEQLQADTEANAASKQQYLDSTKDTGGSSGTTSASSGSTSATSSAVMTLTASQSGSTVTILTQIQNVSSGTCSLTATNGSSSNTQTAKIIYQPQFSSCAGFSVPVSGVGAGVWSISVTATPSGAAPTTKTITLEVK